jgi:O-antigen/teichoic acid export membrane protein
MNAGEATPALSVRARRAVTWSALTTTARFVLQLGAQVTLARLLGPGPYGIYGIGIAVLTFATFLAGTGFSYSLMLQAQVGTADVRFAFTWQLLAGAACALAMVLLAPVMAGWFREPGVASMLRWLALACVLTAASGTALCPLQRELDFRALGLIQLAAYAIGYLGAGVPLALAGWGADALALACVVQAAVVLAGCWWRRPHAARPLLRQPASSMALGTGRTVFFTNLVNWLLGNLDRLVIARVLHTQAVGLYTLAWNLAQIPVTLLVGALQPAFLAAGAQLAGEPTRLAQAWLRVLACVLVLVMPVAVSLALLAPSLVAMLYGPHWQEAGPVLALLFLCLPAWAAWGVSTPVLWNTGRRQLEAGLQWPLLLLAVPAWWLLAPRGLAVAAAVSLLAIHARTLVIVGAALRALGLRARCLLPLLARGGLLSLGCGLTAWSAQAAAHWATTPLALPPSLRAGAALAAGSAAALGAGLLLAWTAPGLLGQDARDMLARVVPFLGQAGRTRASAVAGDA